jgi:hypothetical protein
MKTKRKRELFMKKVTIEINTTNAAFEDDYELVRILLQLANNAKEGLSDKNILDSNGNKVGKVSVK